MTSRRLTVQEAAEVLGTSVDAVRMSVRRGSIESQKDPDGRVYVWVDGDSSETKLRLDGEFSALISAKEQTIEELRDQVGFLRHELEDERESRRRADTIIAQLAHANAALARRVPELEAPREPRDGREGGSEGAEGGNPHPDDGGPQEGSERSWWRRWFGFE